MNFFHIKVQNLGEVTRAFTTFERNVKPSGRLGTMVNQIVTSSYRFANQITHVMTGTLKGAQSYNIKRGFSQVEGKIFINRVDINPLNHAPAYKYALVEHDRGGTHAFYYQTFFNKTIPLTQRLLPTLLNR